VQHERTIVGMLLFDSPIDGVVQAMRKRGRIHGSVLLMVYDRGALAFWAIDAGPATSHSILQ